jgi:hypothetical protein
VVRSRSPLALTAVGLVGLGCGRVGYDPAAVPSSGRDAHIEDAPAPSDDEDAAVRLDSASGVDAATDVRDAATDARDAACARGQRDPLALLLADGTIANDARCSPLSPSAHGTIAYGPGREGRAWQFRSTQASSDGDPDWIELASPEAISSRAITIDAWVAEGPFNAYVGSNRMIVATAFDGAFGPGQALLYVHENGIVYFYVNAGTGTVRDVDWSVCAFANAPLPRAVWTRLTASYDGARLACYRDGALQNTAALRSTTALPLQAFVIGRNYPGDVDAVRIFDRALEDAAVAQPWP